MAEGPAPGRAVVRRPSVNLIPKTTLKPSGVIHQFFSGEGDIPVQAGDAIDQAELEFLRQFKDELVKKDIPFLESIPSDAYLADRSTAMKNKVTVPLKGSIPLSVILGPTLEGGCTYEEPQSYGDVLCAQTISTYPPRGAKERREGDPICDRYGFHQFHNRSICVVADGCNWGERPRNAAVAARDAVLEYIGEKHHKIYSVGDAQSYLLRSFNEAHRKIFDVEGDPGTTTLLAGITLEIQGAPRCPNDWAFVCASVGDCKAFLIEHDTLKVRDITLNNRMGQQTDSDCGGRLGPVMPNGGPDLRNLSTYCIRCQPGDLIVAVSDGVHDNLHPQMLSVSPRDLKLDFDDWGQASKVINIEEAVSKYRVQSLQHLISELECTPRNVLEKIMDHCKKTTSASAVWMQNNPGKRLPNDYRKFPGKMDHTTCVVFRVGIASDSFSRSSSQMQEMASRDFSYIPLCTTLTKSDDTVKIRCRTIAKGKFECLAKRTECILSVAPRVPFTLPGDESIQSFNELSDTISRVINFPKGVQIDIHSKKISYCSETGVITIQFARTA